MAEDIFLIDNSAMNRLAEKSVADVIVPLIEDYKVATCGALEIEALYSSRNAEEYESTRTQRLTIFRYLETSESDWQIALENQRRLASKSQHRGPRVPDLLIAAVAQANGATLLHYDSDFDRIAEVSDLKAEWVVPRGSIS